MVCYNRLKKIPLTVVQNTTTTGRLILLLLPVLIDRQLLQSSVIFKSFQAEGEADLGVTDLETDLDHGLPLRLLQ